MAVFVVGVGEVDAALACLPRPGSEQWNGIARTVSDLWTQWALWLAEPAGDLLPSRRSRSRCHLDGHFLNHRAADRAAKMA